MQNVSPPELSDDSKPVTGVNQEDLRCQGGTWERFRQRRQFDDERALGIRLRVEDRDQEWHERRSGCWEKEVRAQDAERV